MDFDTLESSRKTNYEPPASALRKAANSPPALKSDLLVEEEAKCLKEIELIQSKVSKIREIRSIENSLYSSRGESEPQLLPAINKRRYNT